MVQQASALVSSHFPVTWALGVTGADGDSVVMGSGCSEACHTISVDVIRGDHMTSRGVNGHTVSVAFQFI